MKFVLNKTFTFTVILICLLFICSQSLTMAKTGGADTVLTASTLKYTPVTTSITQVSHAVLWGDPNTGGYGVFTKIKAGYKDPFHTSSSDVRVTIISGTFLYGTSAGEKKLAAGSYMVIPAGVQHTEGADAGADCLYLEQSTGKYEMKILQAATN